MAGDGGERILVSSAQERFALAACRSLAAAGYRVGAVADQTPAPTHWSRHCSERYVLPDVKADAEAFVDGIAAIARRTPYAAMLPATDAALLAVSSRRDRLEPHVALGLPPHEVVERATDKIALDEAARAAGLAAPDTIVCHTHEDGLRAAREIGLPLVIKPRRTVFEDDGRMRQRGSLLLADEESLEQALDGFGRPYVLQRILEGDVWSACGVVTGDGLLSFSVARYLRTWPPKAGNVSYAVTVDPPKGLDQRVQALMAGLRWTGIFELELVRSPSGEFHAIDLNPRLYGSLAHASRAGAPHAVVFTDWLLGRPREPATARAGVGYRWEDADLRNALWSARSGDVRGALSALRPRADVAHAHFALGDPGPLAARALLLARQLLAR